MKKAISRRQPSKKTIMWAIVLGLVGMGLLTWFAVHAVLIAQDRARFAEVSKEKSLIASRLADTLGGNVVSIREQDECFNTEQGPWDNGNLWCQVATIIALKRQVSYRDGASSYVAIAEGMGWHTGSNSPFDGNWAMGSQGVKCQLQYKEGASEEVGLARRIPFRSDEESAFAVACADRARASFYPYNK